MTIDECIKRLQVLADERAFPIQADENALLMAIDTLRMINLPEPGFKVDAVVCMLSAMEESAEITQAASKVIRSITPENPTPVSRLDAKYRLNIEIGDLLCVLLMANKIGLIDRRLIMANCAGKMKRWAERLQGIRTEEHDE